MLYLLRFSSNWITLILTSLAVFSLSCTKPATVPPNSTGVIKSYQRLIVRAFHPPWTRSNISIEHGDLILILASGKVNTWPMDHLKRPASEKLYLKIGKHGYPGRAVGLDNLEFFRSAQEGQLMFAVSDWSYLNSKGVPVWYNKNSGEESTEYSKLGKYWYRDNSGSFRVDIFALSATEESKISHALDAIAQANQSDPILVSQINQVQGLMGSSGLQTTAGEVYVSGPVESKVLEVNEPNWKSLKPDEDMRIKSYDFVPKSTSQIGHAYAVTSVSVDPKGKYALSGSKDHTVRLWELSSGREIRVFKGHTESVNSVVFSPNGNHALSGSHDKTLRLWEVSSGKQVRLFKGHTHHVTCVAFSPDGKYALSGSHDKTIRLWEISSGKQIRLFKGHTDSVTSVTFSPDGSHALSGSWDNNLQLWRIATGKKIKVFKGHTNVITSVSFSPDGEYVLSGSKDNTVRLWELATGRGTIRLEGHTRPVTCVVFSSDGRYVLSGSEDKSVRLWEVANGKKIWVFEGHTHPVTSVAFSPDSNYAISGSLDSTLRLREVATGREVKVLTGHKYAVTCTVFSPDGKYVLSGNEDNSLQLWERSSGKQIRVFKGHTGPVTALAISSDGKFALSGSHDNTVRMWEVVTGREIGILKGHTESVTSVALSSDGKFALSGGDDYTIRVWEVPSGRQIKAFKEHIFGLKSLALSPNGKYAICIGYSLSAHSDVLRLWDLATGRSIRFFRGYFERHSSSISSVKFSPDGKHALTGSWDNTLRLWQANTGTSIRVFEGHTKAVTAVAFSPSGRYALSGSKDNTVRLWEVATGRQIRNFKGHTESITSVAFGPDAKSVLSGSDDGSVRLWDIATGQEIASLYHFKNGEWMVTTPDGYYNSSPEGGPLIYWVLPDGMETFSFEQFESYFKRPDIVKARLAGQLEVGTPTPVVTHPPRIDLAEHMAFKKTDSKAYPLKLRASALEMVTTVRIFVNGKPASEVPVNAKEKNLRIDVPLFSGANRITAIAYDEKGFSSNPKYLDVTCNADLAKPNLYVFAIGVSRYPRLAPSWQLEFAHTDAQALTDTLLKQEGTLFGEVRYNLLINEKASAENIIEVFDALSAVSENDLVIIFMAGHGVKDRDGTFYFLTATGNIKQPRKGGLSWDLLGKYIDRIKARVILFLDACHSGSIVTETVVPNDQLAQQFFSGGHGGVMVFSASKGRQYSMESPDIGGGYGIFTYALVQGLGPNLIHVDSNQNSVVEFMELVGYVSHYVNKETKGEQTPWLSRKELFGDLPLALVD
jgi:WD40 repeat protein